MGFSIGIAAVGRGSSGSGAVQAVVPLSARTERELQVDTAVFTVFPFPTIAFL